MILLCVLPSVLVGLSLLWSPAHSQADIPNRADSATTAQDIDGNFYRTINIDGDLWMAENLQVSRFRNGDSIPEAKTAEEWLAAYHNESPAWCYYNNDPKNGEKYGKLYNWYAVADLRGLAPEGWHVPSDTEWRSLITAYGGMQLAFNKLKEPDGFAAKAAGARYFKDASFNHMENITFWWSSTKNDKWNAWYHAMHFGYKQVGRDNGGMNTGHSIRCLKNSPDKSK